MASPDVEFPWLSSVGESFSGSFNMRIQEGNTTANIHIEEGNTADILPVMEIPTSSVPSHCNIPNPPPLPSKCFRKTRYPKRPQHCSSVPKETKESWDKLFKESHGADVYVITEDRSCIPAHFSILVSCMFLASPLGQITAFLISSIHRSFGIVEELHKYTVMSNLWSYGFITNWLEVIGVYPMLTHGVQW